MVSPIENQLINDKINSVVSSNQGGNSYFDKKWTYEEYMDELKNPVDQPDPNDPNDPRYYRKYAINIPPPDVYYMIPDRKDAVANDVKTQNDRRVYFGWNNLTPYEKNGI